MTIIWIMLLLSLALLLPFPRGMGRPFSRRVRMPSFSRQRRPGEPERGGSYNVRGQRDLHGQHDLRGQHDGEPLPQTLAEAREAELTRQLISGAIDPTTYRRRMSDLAHLGTRPDDKHRTG